MNAKKDTNYTRKRKYTELSNIDIRGVKSIKNIYGKRHTVSISKPNFTKISENEKNEKNISVKNKTTLKISQNYTVSREYSLSVKIRNSQKSKR
jgi:hypothetical protein